MHDLLREETVEGKEERVKELKEDRELIRRERRDGKGEDRGLRKVAERG